MLNVCVTLTGPIDFPFSFFLVIGYEEGAYICTCTGVSLSIPYLVYRDGHGLSPL